MHIMPGCAAINCQNSTEKGFKLFKYPAKTDPVRRQLWIANTKRDKWEPTENSRLCEVQIHNPFNPE